MTQFVSFVFSVGGLIVLLLLGVLWICAKPRSQAARRFVVAITVFYSVIAVHATSFGLSRVLVVGFSPLTAADVPPGRTAVVVLGSGSYTIQDWSDNEYSTADTVAASRVLEAVRIYRMLNPDWVISSGGKPRPSDPDQATGLSMQNLLVQLGVPGERVVTELTSRTTHEESVVVASLLPKLNVQHVVLVTSELHMRRSLGSFRAAGVDAIPAVVRDPLPARSWREWIVPSDRGLWGASLLVHEMLGIGYYAARGWYR